MTNHPNRSSASFRFIAFDMATGQSMAHADLMSEALALATRGKVVSPDSDFIEVLARGDGGLKVWTGGVQQTNPVPLHKARALYTTVFRGPGYFDIRPPVALAEAGA